MRQSPFEGSVSKTDGWQEEEGRRQEASGSVGDYRGLESDTKIISALRRTVQHESIFTMKRGEVWPCMRGTMVRSGPVTGGGAPRACAAQPPREREAARAREDPGLAPCEDRLGSLGRCIGPRLSNGAKRRTKLRRHSPACISPALQVSAKTKRAAKSKPASKIWRNRLGARASLKGKRLFHISKSP